MKKEFLNKLKAKSDRYAKLVKDIETYSNSHFWWETLRDQLIQDNSYNEAVELCKLYIESNPDQQRSHILLAEAYEKTGDIASAIKTYEEYLSNVSNNPAKLSGYYAKAAENFYPKIKVIEIYKTSIKRKPYSVTYKSFVDYLLKNEEYLLAESISNNAIKKYTGKNHYFTLSLADAYIGQGYFEKAKDVLVELTLRSPDHVDAWKKLNKIEEITKEKTSDPEITRTIEFAPEYHSAGISILQNFGKLLRDKYRDIPVKVTITQENLKVKMTIIPPDGKKLEVEEYLHKYGLVVTGKMQVEDLLDNPLQIMGLKTELKMAHVRIEMQKEQMQFMSNQNTSRIASLEEEVKWLRLQIGNNLTIKEKEMDQFFNQLTTTNEKSQQIILSLINALETNNQEKLEESIEELKREDLSNYSQLKSFILNTISSAGANAPTWIEYLSKMIPP